MSALLVTVTRFVHRDRNMKRSMQNVTNVCVVMVVIVLDN